MANDPGRSVPSKDDFLERDPQLRQSILAAAEANLMMIELHENIMMQVAKKGYAEVEVHVDYGNKQ